MNMMNQISLEEMCILIMNQVAQYLEEGLMYSFPQLLVDTIKYGIYAA